MKLECQAYHSLLMANMSRMFIGQQSSFFRYTERASMVNILHSMMSFSHFSLNNECPGLNKPLILTILGTESVCLLPMDKSLCLEYIVDAHRLILGNPNVKSKHTERNVRKTVQSLTTYRIRMNIYCKIDTACCSWNGFTSWWDTPHNTIVILLTILIEKVNAVFPALISFPCLPKARQ
jgi:hypothetical protein